MPIYDFECLQCGAFDAIRKVAERELAAPCPSCNALGARVASDLRGVLTPRRVTMATAEATGSDESEGRYGMRHASLCACCP